MPQPDQLVELAKLANEFLNTMRAAARAATEGSPATANYDGARLVGEATDKASQFTTAALSSPDLARAVVASPGLAALSLVSKDIAAIASDHPDLAELAVMSPNLARVAVNAPEMAEVAKASPALAAKIEALLGRGND